jgi:glycosyltransferase involved in cell wall biosynthesis
MHVITGLGMGGAELALSQLMQKVDKKKYTLQVVSLLGPTPLSQGLVEAGIEVTCLGMKPGRLSLWGLYTLWKVIKEFQPSLLQTWLYHADLMGLIAGKLAGVPRILWNLRCAEMNMSQYSRLSRAVLWLNKCLSSWADGIVCNSEAGKRVHQALGYKNSCWRVIPNGVDGEKFSPLGPLQTSGRSTWAIPQDKLLIGIVGRLDPMKDYPTFFGAAHLVSTHLPSVHFMVVGTGMTPATPQVQSWISQFHLEGRITCLGEQKNMPPLLGLLDIFCSSSQGEGFPNVVAEAMACAIPCVVTDVGDSGVLVGRGITHPPLGEVVPPKDPKALAQALMGLARLTPSERKERGIQGRDFILKTYSVEKMVTGFEDLWKE